MVTAGTVMSKQVTKIIELIGGKVVTGRGLMGFNSSSETDYAVF